MRLESIRGVIGAKGKALAGTRLHSLGRYSHICCKALLPTKQRQIVQCCSQPTSWIRPLKAAVSRQQQIPAESHCDYLQKYSKRGTVRD